MMLQFKNIEESYSVEDSSDTEQGNNSADIKKKKKIKET